ncbi:MAG: hypothetical protein U0984_05435 [Prosthecobacter sp.]|nr:hypothetical protein [Prosthecobacter sp.]
MMPEIPEFVETEIVIRSVHSHRTWHAALPNGKIVIAFVEEGGPATTLEPGARVRARLSVGDFSRAEIVLENEQPKTGLTIQAPTAVQEAFPG